MASACRAAFAVLIAIVGATTIAWTQAPVPAPNPQAPAAAPSAESVKRAEQVLADARKALGGDKLAELKTLVASGRTKRVRGNNLVPIEFEILIELPAKYVRVDELPAEDADPTSAGFNGDALIQIPPPPAMPAGRGAGPGRRRSGATPSAARRSAGCSAGAPAAAPPAPVRTATATPPAPYAPPPPGCHASAGAMPPGMMPRRGCRPGRPWPGDGSTARPADRPSSRTTRGSRSGLFATSSAYPLTFSYAAVAEAPQGRADVLDVKGEGEFHAALFHPQRDAASRSW